MVLDFAKESPNGANLRRGGIQVERIEARYDVAG